MEFSNWVDYNSRQRSRILHTSTPDHQLTDNERYKEAVHMQKNRSEKISSFGISESVGSLQRSHNRETILLMNEYTQTITQNCRNQTPYSCRISFLTQGIESVKILSDFSIVSSWMIIPEHLLTHMGRLVKLTSVSKNRTTSFLY